MNEASDLPRLSRKMPDVLSIRTPLGLRELLRDAAQREGLSVGELARSALADRLARTAHSDRRAA